MHLAKSVLGRFVTPFLNRPNNSLIVLNYHGTQTKFLDNFKWQLDYLAKHYEFIKPKDLASYLSPGNSVKGRKILLTFDDGVRTNLEAAKELDNRAISACFFVVPGFVDCPIDEQKDYFVRNIRPVINPHIDQEPEDFQSMTWEEIRKLSKNHSIGCHTFSHCMTTEWNVSEELDREIVLSKSLIEKQIGKQVDIFCSINNTLLSVNDAAKKKIRENYTWHFTTFGGINNPLIPLAVQRINIESHWLPGSVCFALSALEINRWKNKTNAYHS